MPSPRAGFSLKLPVALLTFLLCASSCKYAALNPFVKSSEKPYRTDIVFQHENRRVGPAAVLQKRNLTLADCRAMALRTNLELQAARFEEMAQLAIRDSNYKRILPHLSYNSELSHKSDLRWSYSDIIGKEGLPPRPSIVTQENNSVSSYSNGHERNTFTLNLEARWTPTDAALAYYMSLTNHNDAGKAHWAKLRVAQRLVEVVEGAFFRLLSLQQCLSLAQENLRMRNSVKRKHDELLENKLSNPEEYYRSEQKRIAAERLLTKILNQIEFQRNILASTMGISPDYCVDGGFYLVGELMPPMCPYKLCDLEMVALQNRPESFQAGLNQINSIYDYRRTIIKYLPKLTGYWKYARDKDKFLMTKDWNDVGLYVYFDLLEYFANRDESKAAAIKANKAQRETGAVAVSLASQVRAAGLKFFDAVDDLRSSGQSLDATKKMHNVVSTRVQMKDAQKLLAEEAYADTLEARINRIKSMGESNAVFAELQSALGINYKEMN